MKKRFLALMSAGWGTALLLTACGHIGNITPDSKVKLNPNKPVSLTVWHYYNGAQQAAFDQLISEFNATEGKEKGIYVEGYTQGSVGDLEKAVSDAVAGAVGAQSLPDIFSTYADTAYAVQKEGKLADLTPYFTKEEQAELIRENPDYGEVICRCEKVTKAEILQAIHNPLGVDTMTGVKYRTRSMMGRCQGGYCQMRIEQMIEQELGKKETEVQYEREGSNVLFGKVREV
jgi:bacterioferritin-associated ferredoxin